MIGHDEIAETVVSYLQQHPDDHERLGLLREALATCDDITARGTLPGHVTCSAVLVDLARRVMHIHHNALNGWLRPGGHLESSDVALIDAALREVEEETGIPQSHPWTSANIHWISMFTIFQPTLPKEILAEWRPQPPTPFETSVTLKD